MNVTVIKKPTCFITEIYNKDTDSDTILPFNSSHPSHTRRDIPLGLSKSAKRLTDDDVTTQVKLGELSDKLVRCGYPVGLVNSAAQRAMSMTREDLRKVKEVTKRDEVIPFVHVYDPSLPQLFSIIRDLTSRLYTNRHLRTIFAPYRIINSQKEPLSLGRQLQHSRFEDRTITWEGGRTTVTKCNRTGCRSCQDILEVSSLYFPNSGILFSIKTEMNCTARNLIYVLFCKKCDYSYIGETVNFRDRMSKHRSNSAAWTSASMEVSRHLYRCGQGFWASPLFKVKQENKIARLVKEDKLVKLLRPELNRDERNLLHLQTY